MSSFGASFSQIDSILFYIELNSSKFDTFTNCMCEVGLGYVYQSRLGSFFVTYLFVANVLPYLNKCKH